MISIEALLERFGPALEVPEHGKCLAIPGSEFDPDWEAELDDQGFTVLFETWDNHPMTVVPLKVSGDKEVQKMENKVETEEKVRVYWSAQEDAFLVELWKSGLEIDQINLSVTEKFPTRVGNAAKHRLDRLKAAGVIQPRQKRVPGNEVKNVEKKEVKVKGSGCRVGPDWSQSEVSLLLDCWKDLGDMSKDAKAKKLAEMEEFAGRSPNSIYQKYYKLQLKTSKEAKKSLETSKMAPAAAEPEPKWNGEFGEKCNLEHDCIDCDIVECPGRKSEGLQKSRITDADVLLDLVGKVQALSDANEKLNSAYVELKEDFEAYTKMQSEIVEAHRGELDHLTAKCVMLQEEIVGHKHFEKTGEAMIPLEA